MDPLTQGALGAIAAASTASTKHQRLSILIGSVAGMLADADILIRSSSDPLLNIEYHRHFSHSLIFIPFGALLCALLFKLVLRERLAFKSIYIYSVLGYATAGLLDACTSYGTRLLWPFSNERIAWNIISVIDPVFTGSIMIAIILGFITQKSKPSKIAWVFVTIYLSFGVYQKHKAHSALVDLVKSRHHTTALNLVVKPSIGNLALWRGIYEYESNIYVDGIFVEYLSSRIRIYEGSNAEKIDPRNLTKSLPNNSPLVNDVDRFADFSDGFLIYHPTEVSILADARYSMIPNSIVPLWGIEINLENPNKHAAFRNFRTKDKALLERFKAMVLGKDLPNVSHESSHL